MSLPLYVIAKKGTLSGLNGRLKASGAQRYRPQLKREGGMLAVWKLDGLARSLKQLIETVEELERRGIGFRSLTEAIDTTADGGELVFHIFAALGEFERSIIRERTRDSRSYEYMSNLGQP
jgi:DNA invertase Pin-like site-specific DNA recombinase